MEHKSGDAAPKEDMSEANADGGPGLGETGEWVGETLLGREAAVWPPASGRPFVPAFLRLGLGP